MSRVSLVVVTLLAFSSPAFAQTPAFSIDLTSLGATDATPVDDDGNPSTLAWVLTLEQAPTATTAVRQLVVMRRQGVCFEAPFAVPGSASNSAIVIVREGSRDMLKVVPSTIRTIVHNPDGTWGLSVPVYAPIELERRLCR